MPDEFEQAEKEKVFVPRRKKHASNQTKKDKTKPTTRIGSEVASTVLQILAMVAVLLLVRTYLFVPVSVDGESMEPTLQSEDRLLLNKQGHIDRFDIVVFPDPTEDTSRSSQAPKQFIKRVIGLPGDHVRVESDVLYINDEPIDEPYLEQKLNGLEEWDLYTQDFSLESITGQSVVPEEHYFLLGDNRGNSKDSRMFGFVPAESVMGETNWRLWPLMKFGSLNHQ